ncbi:dihydrodipicolinate synthase family protein [Micromonospora echinofusca]|uniref:dihydrodipicolinate synthase family protein n=1 Tax=Micromonospora echinofusca TaxID=47858 RepID=UPI000C6FD42D
MEQIPWRGVLAAAALPFDPRDLSVDLDAYAAHVRWLADNGCRGVVPNGSLGEYQVLSAEEREAVVRTAVQAAPAGFSVVPGVSAYGADEARRWAEQAAEAGCQAVMLLPPTAYRADEAAVLAHYREVARAGLPIVAYNNPFDTRVDLTPALLRRLFEEGLVVAVKEFSGDVRRAYEIAELAPGLDLLAGADDVALELLMAGAVGWIGGYQNAIPDSCARLYAAAVAGDPTTAVPLYRTLHPLLRWDSRSEFVQAIKLSMDVAGRPGGPTRQPRQPLPPAVAAEIRRTTERLLAAGHR